MMRTERSKLLLQCLIGAAWTLGAGLCAAWILRGTGSVRPLTCFLIWATALCFTEVALLDGEIRRISMPQLMSKALCYGTLSVLGVALATLFLEYWPVTVTMAFMFAICRSFKDEDTAAYI